MKDTRYSLDVIHEILHPVKDTGYSLDVIHEILHTVKYTGYSLDVIHEILHTERYRILTGCLISVTRSRMSDSSVTLHSCRQVSRFSSK